MTAATDMWAGKRFGPGPRCRRVAERDLARLKARAAEEGMPYQTLINSILHKYVEG
ncbi:protein of unknown function [Aminobacter niigataensis]|nr:protein of unknown function [Aminobacter niigataensis]